MELEKLVATIIHLLEEQESAKISYRIIPLNENRGQKKESA